MAVTSPDNIWTPDAGDDYALTTDLAATADSVQDALNTVRGDNRAFSGLDADRPAAGVEGRTWYSTDTNRSWFDNGTNWVSNDQGLYLIHPTSTIASGVTIGADGTVTFTSATAAGAGVSGVFTSRFRSYEVVYNLTHTLSNLQFRVASGGSPITASNYVTSNAHISGSTVTAASATTSVGTANSVSSASHSGVIEFLDPADASKNTSYIVRGNGDALPSWGGGWYNSLAAHDGLVILPGSAVPFSGWMKIYGRI